MSRAESSEGAVSEYEYYEFLVIRAGLWSDKRKSLMSKGRWPQVR